MVVIRCTALVLLAGCAASQPRASTPQEIVVEQGEVVRVPRRARGEGELPPLPVPLASTSQTFQRGHALALELLQAPGPGAPAAQDEQAYRAWLSAEVAPWLTQRRQAVDAAIGPLGEVADAAPSEHVVAAGLVGLIYARIYDQLVGVPPPAGISADEKLARIYQSEVHASAASWIEGAISAFRSCATRAARQRDLAFGLWLDFCHRQLAAREQQLAQAQALRERVKAEREADRLAAEGSRPDGPEICWTPNAGRQPAPAAAETPAQGPAAAETAPGAAAAGSTAAPAAAAPPASAAPPTKPRTCALAPGASDPAAALPQSPRDLRFGPRDPETGVRVSVVAGDNPTMDAGPLAWLDTQLRLARCFAKHVPADKPITVALHANLSIDARGRTKSVALTPEPSDAAAKPNDALSRCLAAALKQTAFDCSPSGQPTQARVGYCLRRD